MNLTQEVLLRFYDLTELAIKELRKNTPDVFIQYIGNLNEPFSNALNSRLEKIIEEKFNYKALQKRFFNVFIEVVQNIRIHGIRDEDDHIHAGIIVYQNDNKLYADFYNVVTNKQADYLQSKYSEINSLSDDTLKRKYMDIMLHGELSLKGGAGLGIITIVLKSKNPSKVDVSPINKDFKLFHSHIEVG